MPGSGLFHITQFYGVCAAGHRIKTYREKKFARWWTQHNFCEFGDDWRLH